MNLTDKLFSGFKKVVGGLAFLGALSGNINKADALQLEIYTEQWTDHSGTLLPDGSPIQFIWAGPNGRIDEGIGIPYLFEWIAAGCPPLGDDQLISSNPEWPSYGAPAEQGTWMGYAWTGNYLSDPYPEPPDASTYLDPANNITAANPYVYVRVFDARAVGILGRWWGNSELGWVDVGSPVPFTVYFPGGRIWVPDPPTLELLAAVGGVIGGAAYFRNRRAKKKEKTT